MGLSVLGAALGILAGLKLYSNLNLAEDLKKRWSRIHKFLDRKWYVDEIYEFSLVRPFVALSKALWKGVDVAVIDRFVLGLGRVSMRGGQGARLIQTGSIQVYMVVLVIGLVFSLGYMIYGLA